MNQIVFGPVPSRRLGRSLGINNILPKACCYACVYCQLGPTHHQEVERRGFYPPAQIRWGVSDRVAALRAANERVDYLTFVADGEPTLDRHLGETIDQLRPLGIPIAVITNAALIDRPDVRADLARADWVSVKVDSVRERLWTNINRPYNTLRLPDLLEGIRQFAASFRGMLTTETMLVRMVNDSPPDVAAVAAFLAEIQPATAYLAVPTRPPAEPWVEPPDEETLNAVYQVFRSRLRHVELLIGYEGDAFASTGDAATDLLSITAVHPLRARAVDGLLAKTGADFTVVQRLLADRKLIETDYQGERYYLRPLGRRGKALVHGRGGP